MASWVNEAGAQIVSPAAPYTDDREVMDQICLDYVRRGGSPQWLAKYLKVSKRTIERNIERARLHEQSSRSEHADPYVEPLFGCNPHTPLSPCAHPKPIPQGRREYCPQCHETGIEAHPALRRRPGDLEARGPRPAPKADGLNGGTDGPSKRKHATRKPKPAACDANAKASA